MHNEIEEGLSATADRRGLSDISEWIGAHQQALRLYCRSLAGSPWEGDDLAQDTWLKVWSALLGGKDDEQITRAYLYRIARNAWIDRSRKRMLSTVREPLEDELHVPQISPLEIYTAMETLVQTLVPAQRTALLLIDILKYSAAEAAKLIGSTEGAVKAALHRARTKLKMAVAVNNDDKEYRAKDGAKDGAKERTKERATEGDKSETDELMTYAYLEAFRQQNTTAMVMLMNDSAPKEAVVSLLHARQKAERPQIRTHSPSIHNLYMQLAA